MSNILVIDTLLQAQQQASDFSVLGFRSILPTSTITGQAENASLPFSNVLDFRDNTKYSPAASSGSVVIIFDQSTITEMDYWGLAIHNGQSAGLTGTLEIDEGAGFVVESSFSGLVDDRPFLDYFGSKNSQRQRLTLNFTSNLFISAIYLGKSVVFNRAPSLGFQPARFSSLDKVEQFTTDGNNFIIGRRINRGFQAKGSFNFVNFTDIEATWEDFSNHVLDSQPVFFKWSNSKDQVVFGLQPVNSLHKPSYVTSHHSNVSFTIEGYA